MPTTPADGKRSGAAASITASLMTRRRVRICFRSAAAQAEHGGRETHRNVVGLYGHRHVHFAERVWRHGTTMDAIADAACVRCAPIGI